MQYIFSIRVDILSHLFFFKLKPDWRESLLNKFLSLQTSQEQDLKKKTDQQAQSLATFVSDVKNKARKKKEKEKKKCLMKWK